MHRTSVCGGGYKTSFFTAVASTVVNFNLYIIVFVRNSFNIRVACLTAGDSLERVKSI
jgi:hypothetical protein